MRVNIKNRKTSKPRKNHEKTDFSRFFYFFLIVPTHFHNQERLRAKAENRKNPAVEIFYITTILFRAILELWFLFVEYNLNLNQSQNANFLETMQLKEKYYCYTHFDDNPYDDKHSVDYFLPVANRSEIFYTDEVIETCQQQDRVTGFIFQVGVMFLGFYLVITRKKYLNSDIFDGNHVVSSSHIEK